MLAINVSERPHHRTIYGAMRCEPRSHLLNLAL